MKLTAATTATLLSLTACALALPAPPDLASELHSAAAGEASVLDSLASSFPEIATIQSEVDNSQVNTASIASQFADLATDSAFQSVVQANPTLASLFSEFDAVFATPTAKAKAKAKRA